MSARSVLRLAAFLTLGAAVAAIMIQHARSVRLQEDSQAIIEAATEAERLVQENAALVSLRSDATNLSALRAEAREADQLRAEVWRLRTESKQRDSLLAENQRWLTLTNSAIGPISALTNLPGYLAATAWVDVGLNTPEGALQTFLYAMRARDLKRVLECMTPAAAAEFMHGIEKLPEAQRAQAFDGHPFTLLRGYRVVDKVTAGDDSVLLHVQTALGVAAHRMPLQRVGAEWRFAADRL